jgi:hypothetical protein
MKLTTTIALGAILLTGCTTKVYYSEPPPESTTIARSTTTVRPIGQPRHTQKFLDAVRAQSTGARIMNDDDLISAGEATCRAFDSGMTGLDVATVMTNNMGNDQRFNEMLIATASMATLYLCPEHSSKWGE